MIRTTQSILDTIRCRGYAVSEFKLPSSLLGTFPAAIEMHAVKLATSEQHVARVDDDGEDAPYRRARLLAGMVGISPTASL